MQYCLYALSFVFVLQSSIRKSFQGVICFIVLVFECVACMFWFAFAFLYLYFILFCHLYLY